MLYVNKTQWRGDALNELFILEQYILEIRRKQEWWILECIKKLGTIIFGNWNKTRTNSILEMGKSSSKFQMYLRVHH